jgi:hypothetical protein
MPSKKNELLKESKNLQINTLQHNKLFIAY